MKNPKHRAAYNARQRLVQATYRARHPHRALALRARRREQVSGMSTALATLLREAQKGRCAVCALPIEGKNEHADHDHVTGKARGLLCSKCNSGIGLLDDNVDRLLAAVEYLKNPPANQFDVFQ